MATSRLFPPCRDREAMGPLKDPTPADDTRGVIPTGIRRLPSNQKDSKVDENRKDEARRVPDQAKLNTLVSATADAQVKARAESKEKAEKAERRRRLHPLVPFLLLFPLAGILYLNLTRAPSVPPVPVEISLQETVYLTVRVLDAEYEETGAFPSDLSEIGMDEEGLLYAQTSEGYRLVAEEGSFRVEYEYGEDLGPLLAAFETLLPPFEEVR